MVRRLNGDLDELGVDVGLPAELISATPGFRMVASTRVDLHKIPIIGALEGQHPLRQAGGTGFLLEKMAPKADRQTVDWLSLQSRPYAFTFLHLVHSLLQSSAHS